MLMVIGKTATGVEIKDGNKPPERFTIKSFISLIGEKYEPEPRRLAKRIKVLRMHDYPHLLSDGERKLITNPSVYGRRRLNKREKETIKLLCNEGAVQAHIAETFGISESMVSLIVNGKR
jgi:uncharacterized membrane protein